jgi:hypothetical protein
VQGLNGAAGRRSGGAAHEVVFGAGFSFCSRHPEPPRWEMLDRSQIERYREMTFFDVVTLVRQKARRHVCERIGLRSALAARDRNRI